MSVPRPYITAIGGIPAGNSGGKRPASPTHITDHHIVGDAPAAIARFQQASGVSATFVIAANGTIYQMLDLMTIPYTDGNYQSNKRAITIEHAGGHPTVPYTEAMYASAVHLHAWLRQEYGIPESNILKHRDVIDRTAYPGGTACPGDLDVDRIKRESSNMLNQEDPVRIAELEQQTRDMQSQIDIMRPDLVDSHNRIDGLTTELTAERASYEARIAGLEAQLETAQKNTAIAITTAAKAAPQATKAPWYVRLVAALTSKK